MIKHFQIKKMLRGVKKYQNKQQKNDIKIHRYIQINKKIKVYG